MRVAIFCVGNRLMLDDGIGPAAYDALLEGYDIPENVDLYDLGCMSMNLIPKVNDYDFIISVDAVDGTGEKPGTIFRFSPYDSARHNSAMTSLHDLKLIDLFDAASLLGYHCEGICYGMQIENMSPAEFIEGLTPDVHKQLPLLVESVVAHLDRLGIKLQKRKAQ